MPPLKPCCRAILLLLLASPGFAIDYEPGEEYTQVLKHVIHTELPADIPPRGDEGMGPFARLLIKDAIIIDGSGQPAYGPASVLIEQDRIVQITTAADNEAYSALQARRDIDQVIDAQGQYLLPGFIDAHVHFISETAAHAGPLDSPDYAAKLYLGHGITTVRDTGSAMGLDWTLRQKKHSDAGTITAPRILAYAMFPGSADALRHYYGEQLPGFPQYHTERDALRWLKAVQKKGADGVKFQLKGWPVARELYQTLIGQIKERNMGVATHFDVPHITALDHARWGADSTEHIESIADALRRPEPPAKVPADYIRPEPPAPGYGSHWANTHPPGSGPWQDLIAQLVALDHTLVPTLAINEVFRDFMRSQRAEWHQDYTRPTLDQAFQPNPAIHGSDSFLNWSTADEIVHKEKYQISFQFLKDFHRAGGRIATGSDAGFMFQVYGFAFIRELELLQEAGLSPLEVIKAATLNGAELIDRADDLGSIAVGKKADLVLVAENPLRNFKVLYGTGYLRYNPATEMVERSSGIRYTIKDGIVWDTQQLLADVRAMVDAEHASIQQQGTP